MGLFVGILLILAGFWVFQMAWQGWSDRKKHDEYGVDGEGRQQSFALVTFLIAAAMMFAGFWFVL